DRAFVEGVARRELELVQSRVAHRRPRERRRARERVRRGLVDADEERLHARGRRGWAPEARLRLRGGREDEDGGAGRSETEDGHRHGLCRQLSGAGRPSIEGQALLQPACYGQHERVLARPSDELHRGGKTVLRGPGRERERRPAEHVDRVREAGEQAPVVVPDPADRRRDEGERRRDQQVEWVEELEAALPVDLALRCRLVGLALRAGEILLELLAEVRAVALLVLGEESLVDARDLV